MSKIDKLEELQNILKSDPNNFQVRREFAVLLLDCNYPEEALQHFLYLSNPPRRI
jgi:thioredoxin-like negative regulator of GroEL